MPPADSKPPVSPGPELRPGQEVRLAVVMYGGVSLACYMNGVAQELYHLVRATAPATDGTAAAADAARCVPGHDLSGTQTVYRKLGQMLSRGRLPNEAAAENPASPVRTRFRIDILSGSSAGGINAIFLAKALANNQKIEQLTRLWIEHGDIDALLNDRRPAGTEPASLLDGQYMYGKLLDALDGMDAAAGARDWTAESPNARELDLYITATDIRGLPLPLRLADHVVYEKRHRKVFHFVYAEDPAGGEPRNDFLKKYNRFLAFAARCTSAYPFAFAPEKLADIDAFLKPGETEGAPTTRAGTPSSRSISAATGTTPRPTGPRRGRPSAAGPSATAATSTTSRSATPSTPCSAAGPTCPWSASWSTWSRPRSTPRPRRGPPATWTSSRTSRPPCSPCRATRPSARTCSACCSATS
jgi:patatin-related protein